MNNGPFPASEKTQGQPESRTAHARFVDEKDDYGWAADYTEAASFGLRNWRHIAFVCWASSPEEGRDPETQEAFAVDVLGLASDQVIPRWRRNNPEIDQAIFAMQAGPLMRSRRDAFEALAESATTPDANRSADRRLFFTMTGDLVESSKRKVDQTTAVTVKAYETISPDDWDAAEDAQDGAP